MFNFLAKKRVNNNNYHCQFDLLHETQKKFPESYCEHDVMKEKISFILRLRVKQLQWQDKKNI